PSETAQRPAERPDEKSSRPGVKKAGRRWVPALENYFLKVAALDRIRGVSECLRNSSRWCVMVQFALCRAGNEARCVRTPIPHLCIVRAGIAGAAAEREAAAGRGISFKECQRRQS